MTKKKKPLDDDNLDSFRRTLTAYYNFSANDMKIIDFMATISKNIFNTTIFCCSIFDKYKDNIFRELYFFVKNTGVKLSLQSIDNELLTIYEKYYNEHCTNKDKIRTYNDFIYKYIINTIIKKNIIIVNDNFDTIKNRIINDLLRFKGLIYNHSTDEQLFFPIIHDILRSMYMKNYYRTKQQMINNQPIDIKDEKFINQVKKNECLFNENNKINYKKLIEEYINRNFIKKAIIRNSKEYKNDETNFEYLRGLSPKDFLQSNFFQKFLQKCKSKKEYNRDDMNSENFFDSEEIKDHDVEHKDDNIVDEINNIKLKANQTYIQRFIYTHLHDNTNKLSSDLTVGIIKKAYESYISFYGLKTKGIKCNRVKYLKKDEKFNLMFYAHHCIITKNENNTTDTVRLTLGSYIAKNYISITEDNSLICVRDLKNLCDYKTANGKIIEGNYLYLHLPKKLTEDGNKLNLIEIIPKYNGHCYKINYTYTFTQEKCQTVENNNVDFQKDYLSIDLGTTNLMAIYDPDGEQYLIKGYYLIRLNESYNYHIGRLQSALMKSQGKKTSWRIRNMFINHSNRINDYFNKIVRWFVNNYRHKKKIIIGYNINWKNGVNLGRDTNRKFCRIPYMKLLRKLKETMELLGIEVITNEESYTSKCDALAKEPVKKHAEYLGDRTRRGLFLSSVGKLVNADINGAINIMRKYTKSKERREIQNITGKNLFNPKKVKHDDIRKGNVLVM